MKGLLSLCIVIQIFNTDVFCQKKQIDSLIIDFKGFLFDYKIQPARRALEIYEQAAIPKIIPLLYSNKFTPISNNPYLMYPASKEYMYTHGYIIPYHLDWISIRAGWLMEELTFMDFGFKTALDEKKYAVLNDYSHNGKKEVPWINVPTKASLLKSRKPMADAVASWWQKNKAIWTRIGALKDALQSNNTKRQLIALNYLINGFRNEEEPLTSKYLNEIAPLVLVLKKSTHKNIAQYAERLEKIWLYKDK